MKKYLPPGVLKEAEDGKGIFIRSSHSSTRDLVEMCNIFMDKMSDITFFPNKTTLLEALRDVYASSGGHKSMLWTGFSEDKEMRMNRLRAESYAVKKMFLEVLNCEKGCKTGVFFD